MSGRRAKPDRRTFLRAAGIGAALGATSMSARGAEAASDGEAAPLVAQGTAGELCDRTAIELAALIRARKVSAREVMAAHLARIRRTNPTINAIVAKLDDDACLALADAADRRAAAGESLGPLHGLPTAFKDLQPAVGFPYTRGSLIFKDATALEDSVLVERIRRAGAIAIGKTNTPEFGLGSHTFNRVYGVTRNPYDQSKSAGGSSGGAGAALAAGMLPIADGSDMGGSLRNPGNFNNVVGFRPTVGLVPTAPNPLPLFGFTTNGPLARTVADVALLMSVMAGADPRDPACLPSDPASFLGRLDRDVRGTRIAWCPDLGGLPLDPRVRAVLATQRKTFEDLGCVVEDAAPDLRDADNIFLTLRAFRNGEGLGALLAEHRDKMKAEAVAEIEAGLALTSAAIGRAMRQHGALLERMRKFEERFDFVCCAVNQVAPFDATIDWPKTIDGVAMDHYIAWMKSAYWITTTFRPAISVPAGFTPEGLPVGLQIVGRPRGDFALLQMAWRFEQATNIGRRRPPMA
jgi:amidase